MALDTRKLRNLVVGATLLLVIAGVAIAFESENPQRAQMEWKIRELDSRLVQKRAIARDLERYRIEIARLRMRLAEAKQILTPDLDAIAGKMTIIGVSMARSPETIEGFYKRWPQTLEGKTQVELDGAVAILKNSGNLWDYVQVERPAGSWRLEVATFTFLERRTPPRAEEQREDDPWYAWINEEHRKIIEEKQREEARLDELIGDVREFTELKRELEDRLQIIDSLQRRIRTPPD
jgi:hypothetical protein